MNVFGEGRSKTSGPRGPRGFPGKDSTIKDFCTWLPNTLLKQLQDYEEACYVLDYDNPENDIKRQGRLINEWKSRNAKKGNLVAIKPSSTLIETRGGQHAVQFKNNLYQYKNWFAVHSLEGYGYICITFKTESDEEQALLTNHEQKDPLKLFHEISVSANEINVYGYMHDTVFRALILHNCREWTTLFIEYTNHDGIYNTEFTYTIDGNEATEGSFIFQRSMAARSGGEIGGRKDGTKSFVGAIHALETYFTDSPKLIPKQVKQLVIKKQLIREY